MVMDGVSQLYIVKCNNENHLVCTRPTFEVTLIVQYSDILCYLTLACVFQRYHCVYN